MDKILRARAAISVEPPKADKPARFSIKAYSGGKMRPQGFAYPVVAELSGLSVRRQPLPILRDHDQGRVVGHANKVTIDREGVALSGVISGAGPDADEIKAAAKNEFPWQASVGVRMERLKFYETGQKFTANGRTFEGPAYHLAQGELFEVSIVAIGGDPTTETTIQAKGQTMPPEIEETTGGAAVETTATLEAQLDAARVAERERIARIDQACDIPGIDRNRLQTIRAQAISGEITENALNSTLLSELRASRGAGPAIHGGNRRSDASQVDVLTAAMLCRNGREETAVRNLGEQVVEQARREHGRLAVTDFHRMALQASGEYAGRVQSSDLLQAAAQSTMSWPNLLGDTVGRALEMIFRDTPATWRSIAAVREAPDFRERKNIRPAAIDNLEEVGNGGELKHSAITEESTYSWRVATYGKTVGMGRTDIINDDLSAVDELVASMSDAAMRSLSDLFWSTVLGLGASYFASGLGNLTDQPLTELELATAIAAMLNQKDSKDNNLDIRAATLVVGPTLAHTARGLLNSEYIQKLATESGPTGNPLRNALSLEVEPRLENTDKYAAASTTQWYLFGSPATAAMIVGFLNGVQAPQIITHPLGSTPGKLLAQWDIVFDYGVAGANYLAAYKSTGDA